MGTRLDWAGSRSGHVASYSECGNEDSGDPNCRVCLWLVEGLSGSKEGLFSLQLFSVSTEVFTLATSVKTWYCYERLQLNTAKNVCCGCERTVSTLW